MTQNPMERPHRPSDNPRNNFVAPHGGGDRPPPAAPIRIINEDGQQFPIQVAEISKTSAVDRAKAFSLKTVILGFFLSIFVVAGVWKAGGRGVVTIALSALACYAAVWVFAYWQDIKTSPGGLALRVAIAKLRESNRHSRSYDDAYRQAHGLPSISNFQRFMERFL